MFVADEIAKLRVLLERGAITEDEYQQQKRHLLGTSGAVTQPKADNPTHGTGETDYTTRETLAESVTQPQKVKRRGVHTGLLLVLVLVLAEAALYAVQDKVVEMWPSAEGLLLDMGLRVEKPGAGLELSNTGTPEHVVFNDTDMLIVRGVIANVSDRTRMVPPMKLMLLDKDKHVVQEKIYQPPVTSLDPGGKVSFEMRLERSHPAAVELNVVFVNPGEPYSATSSVKEPREKAPPPPPRIRQGREAGDGSAVSVY